MKQSESLTGSVYYVKERKRWKTVAYDYDLDDNRTLTTKTFKTKTEAKNWLNERNELTTFF